MSVWVHPAGKEIWLIQSAKAAPPTPVAAKAVHPDIEEIQTYVSQYAARKADMIRKPVRSTPGAPRSASRNSSGRGKSGGTTAMAGMKNSTTSGIKSFPP